MTAAAKSAQTIEARDRRQREDAPVTTPPILLDGRTFRLATSYTFEADLYVFEQLTASGVLKTFADLGSTPDLDEARATFVIRAYRSGHLFKLLAGVLVEDGAGWTPQIAASNAAFFAQRSDPGEKQALLEALVLAVASFFLSAGPSSATSRLMSSGGIQITSSGPADPHSDASQPDGLAASPMTSATGPR